MNDQTKNRITRIIKDAAPHASDQQINWSAEHGFQKQHVSDLMNHLCPDDPLKVEMTLAAIDAERNREETKVTGKLPLPGLPPAPMRWDEEPEAKKAPVANDKKWWVGGGVVVVALLIGAMIVMNTNCLGDDGKNAGAAVSQPEEADNTRWQAIESRMDTFETNMSDLGTKVDGVKANTDKTAVILEALNTKVDEGLSTKADQSALDETDGRLTRLEKKVHKKADKSSLKKTDDKLDAHIADDDEIIVPSEDDDVDEPVQPETAESPGTVTLKVPKGAKVRTRYSKQ